MTACSLIGHSPLKADVFTRSDVVQGNNLLLMSHDIVTAVESKVYLFVK